MSASSENNGQIFALIAEFQSPGDIMAAAEKVRDAGFKNWDVITPFPIHGMDQAMGLSRSKIPLVAFCGGLTGFTLGMTMVWYMNQVDYPLIVGGMPYFSPVFPFPVAYELTILFAAIGSILSMFLFNSLPMHHHPTLNYEQIEKASNDRYFIVIESSDPQFDENKTPDLLKDIGGSNIGKLED